MFSTSVRWAIAVGFFFAIFVSTAGRAAAQNDPAAQFSPVLNPVPIADGFWSYGYENFPLPNPFLPLTVPIAVPVINSWQTPSFGEVGVFHNGTAAPQTYTTAIDGAVYQPGEIGMHPGPNDQYGIVQFTATVPGNYDIKGTFVGLDSSGLTDTDVRLLWDNTTVASGTALGFVPVPLSAGPFFLNAGDTLAYAVGGNPVFGSTGLIPGSASVSAAAVPEPTSLAAICTVTVLLAGYRVSRRAALIAPSGVRSGGHRRTQPCS